MTLVNSAFSELDHPTKSARLAGVLLSPWRFLKDAIAHRRTCVALYALDDHLLKDIGISRSEIAWRARWGTPQQ